MSNKDKPWISQRWLMVFFITMSSSLIFVLRYNMSVVIVAMVAPIQSELRPINQTTNQSVDSSSIAQMNHAYHQALVSEAQLLAATSFSAALWFSSQSAVAQPNPSNSTFTNASDEIIINPVPEVRTFDWDETTQGQILSSYFYGYLLFQVLGGRLCEKMGPKWVLAAGTVVPGLLTGFTPTAAYLGEFWLLANRICIGAFHALVLSSCYAFTAIWMPEKEKSSAVIWINIGFEIGGFFTLLWSGYISSQPMLGWECAFYSVGLMPLIWFIPYIFCVHSTPESHPRLSTYERKLLEHSRAAALSCQDFSRRVKRIPPKLRWGTLLTSRPVWANVIGKTGGYFGCYLMATKLPAYMAEVHDLPLGHNGLFCALTFLGTICAKLVCLRVSPWLQNKRWVSVTTQRKMFQCGAQLIAATCLFAVNWFADDVTIALTLIVITMSALGMQCAGEAANLADFAQDLSGTVFGFANTFTCFGGIISPILTGKSTE